jgi:hypothetical protein
MFDVIALDDTEVVHEMDEIGLFGWEIFSFLKIPFATNRGGVQNSRYHIFAKRIRAEK